MSEPEQRPITLTSILIDNPAGAYRKYLRSIRLLRAWSGVVLMALVFILLFLLIVVSLGKMSSDFVAFGIILVFGLIYGYLLLYFFRALATASVKGVGITLLFIILISLPYIADFVEAGIDFWSLVGSEMNVIETSSSPTLGESFKGFVESAEIFEDKTEGSELKWGQLFSALSNLPFLVLMCLTSVGLIHFLWFKNTPFFSLFQDKNYSDSILIRVGDLWTYFSKLMGVNVPSSRMRRTDARAIAACLAAFHFEGNAFAFYFVGIGRGFEKIRELSGQISLLYAVVLLTILSCLGVLFASLFLSGSKKLRQYALRRLRRSADQVQSMDPRSPILFLRTFRDDQVSLLSTDVPYLARFFDPGVLADTLEHLSMRELEYLGPMIMIGNPSDQIPPLGAARKYVRGANWQEIVQSLIQESTLIIVGVDRSEGLTWEIDNIRRHQLLRKTIFLIPPGNTKDIELLRHLLDLVGFSSDENRVGELAPQNESDQKLNRLEGAFQSTALASNSAHVISLAFPEENRGVLLTSNRVTEIEYALSIRSALSPLDLNQIPPSLKFEINPTSYGQVPRL